MQQHGWLDICSLLLRFVVVVVQLEIMPGHACDSSTSWLVFSSSANWQEWANFRKFSKDFFS